MGNYTALTDFTTGRLTLVKTLKPQIHFISGSLLNSEPFRNSVTSGGNEEISSDQDISESGKDRKSVV